MQKDRKTALFRGGDALVTGFNSDQQSFESAAVPECESDNKLLWRMGRFRGAGQPAFEAFFISRFRKIRKATPTLMRGHVSHRPMPATACSASLRCHRSRYSRPSRSPGDDAEAVFVLVALRGFAQFSGNQCQRAQSEHEKACG
jgi:hypothetical protein